MYNIWILFPFAATIVAATLDNQVVPELQEDQPGKFVSCKYFLFEFIFVIPSI
jgi:hypothetical protein